MAQNLSVRGSKRPGAWRKSMLTATSLSRAGLASFSSLMLIYGPAVLFCITRAPLAIARAFVLRNDIRFRAPLIFTLLATSMHIPLKGGYSYPIYCYTYSSSYIDLHDG